MIIVNSKDEFDGMIDNWRADNMEEMEDLIIGNIECINGQWQAEAEDTTTQYILTDDGEGNIVINYIGTKN
jgi:hypothetical protein